jgi:Kdo2-lipid IVA lauroyltransferase/acyltransferase
MLEACRAANEGGAVAVSLHSGNWEMMVPVADSLGCAVMGLYQRLQNPLVEQHVLALRQAYYRGGLVAKSPSAPRQMLRTLNQGGIVGLLADLRDDNGIAVPFFGRAAPSTSFPGLLARQRKVPIFALRVLRTKGARFTITAERIDPVITADRDADALQATSTIQATFERWIREEPSQWMWGHQRYKKIRPPRRRPRKPMQR